MTLSMYQTTIPLMTRMLGNLSTILDKAKDKPELLDARLAPDMFPFTRQIQLVSDAAKGAAARLAGLDVPSYADTETTHDQLQARITRTLAFLASITPEQMDGSETRPVTIHVRGNDLTFDGQTYLLHFALPNFYFHITAAYCILRAHGVELGKLDYLGRPNNVE